MLPLVGCDVKCVLIFNNFVVLLSKSHVRRVAGYRQSAFGSAIGRVLYDARCQFSIKMS
jgi:hypothetical protein